MTYAFCSVSQTHVSRFMFPDVFTGCAPSSSKTVRSLIAENSLSANTAVARKSSREEPSMYEVNAFEAFPPSRVETCFPTLQIVILSID